MRSILFAAALVLTGCGSPGTEDSAPKAEPAAAAATPPAAVPQPQGSEPSPEATPAEAFDWTGRFAASEQLCSGGVWEISRERISTAGETSCTVDAVEQALGKVELRLSCLAEGMSGDERWTLSPRGADGIKVRRDMPTETIDVDLIRCS